MKYVLHTKQSERSGLLSASLIPINDVFSFASEVEWWVWFSVAIALLCSVLWSREMLVGLKNQSYVKRLFVFTGIGIIVLIFAYIFNKPTLIAPVGIGTVAHLVAGIVDEFRQKTYFAYQRLIRIIRAVLGTLVLSFLFALVFGWVYIMIPILLLTSMVVVRYSVFKSNNGYI